jgi:hypothetical protein
MVAEVLNCLSAPHFAVDAIAERLISNVDWQDTALSACTPNTAVGALIVGKLTG